MNLKRVMVLFVVCFAVVVFSVNSGLASQMVLSKNKAQIYGFVRTDFIYDDAESRTGELLSFTESDDDNADNFYGTARFSRIGIDFEDGDISAKVEGDFYGDIEGNDEHSTFRLRHFYVKANQGKYSFLAGQTWHLTPLIFPSINNGMAGGYSGALWHRTVQARLSYAQSKKLNFAVALTRPTRLNHSFGNNGTESGQPGLEAKVTSKIGGGKLVLSGALGAWENDAGGTTADVELLAMGYSFPLGPVTLSGQAWTGQNLKDFLGSPGMGYEDNAVEAKGGFVDVSAPLTSGVTLSGGHGVSDPDEDASSVTFDKNSTSYVTGAFKLFEKISTKVTYAKNKTDNFGGSDLENNHYQTSFTYVF